MSNKMYVGNLSGSSTESDLRETFASYGCVESVTIVKSRATGLCRGFAYVEMAEIGSMKRAICALNQTVLGGRTIGVRAAHSTEDLPRRGA